MERLLINPLFMDALSGKFTDRRTGQEHTAGRLLVATLTKGSAVDLRSSELMLLEDGINTKGRRYSPSWAGDIEVTAFLYTSYSRNRALYEVAGLSLRAATGNLLAATIQDQESNLQLLVQPADVRASHPLEVGPRLEDIQRHTTAAFQHFFNTVAPAA